MFYGDWETLWKYMERVLLSAITIKKWTAQKIELDRRQRVVSVFGPSRNLSLWGYYLISVRTYLLPITTCCRPLHWYTTHSLFVFSLLDPTVEVRYSRTVCKLQQQQQQQCEINYICITRCVAADFNMNGEIPTSPNDRHICLLTRLGWIKTYYRVCGTS